jgi:uncharacterized protein YxeA
MKDIVISLVALIVLLGITVWALNNENGIGNGVHSLSKNINTKVDGFDYSGTIAPGTGQNGALKSSSSN